MSQWILKVAHAALGLEQILTMRRLTGTITGGDVFVVLNCLNIVTMINHHIAIDVVFDI